MQSLPGCVLGGWTEPSSPPTHGWVWPLGRISRSETERWEVRVVNQPEETPSHPPVDLGTVVPAVAVSMCCYCACT